MTELKNSAQGIVTAGKSSGMIPENCPVVVNGGKPIDYQNFRNGVKLGSYSNVTVDKVEANDKGTTVTKVYVKAKVKSSED